MYETAATTAADGMMLLGASIKDAQLLSSQTKFDQCVEILNGMLKGENGISNKDYFRIVREFMEKEKSEYYPALFVGMDASLRKEWLIEEKLLEDY